MVSEDFRKQALGYGLTTAHILYWRPDHRWLLQSYIWQNYDLFPEFPELHRQGLNKERSSPSCAICTTLTRVPPFRSRN
jgi:uncharacterized protein Usg